jgi:hypothetical protein
MVPLRRTEKACVMDRRYCYIFYLMTSSVFLLAPQNAVDRYKLTIRYKYYWIGVRALGGCNSIHRVQSFCLKDSFFCFLGAFIATRNDEKHWSLGIFESCWVHIREQRKFLLLNNVCESFRHSRNCMLNFNEKWRMDISNILTLRVCVLDSLYCVVEIRKNKTRMRKIIGAIIFRHRSPITAFLRVCKAVFNGTSAVIINFYGDVQSTSDKI